MSATITWSIDQMRVTSADAPNFVCNVTYKVQAEQDGWIIETKSPIEFYYSPSASFTPFDELTEAVVLQWVMDALGPVQVAQIQASLNQQMDYHFNPPVTPQPAPLPWSKG